MASMLPKIEAVDGFDDVEPAIVAPAKPRRTFPFGRGSADDDPSAPQRGFPHDDLPLEPITDRLFDASAVPDTASEPKPGPGQFKLPPLPPGSDTVGTPSVPSARSPRPSPQIAPRPRPNLRRETVPPTPAVPAAATPRPTAKPARPKPPAVAKAPPAKPAANAPPVKPSPARPASARPAPKARPEAAPKSAAAAPQPAAAKTAEKKLPPRLRKAADDSAGGEKRLPPRLRKPGEAPAAEAPPEKAKSAAASPPPVMPPRPKLPPRPADAGTGSGTATPPPVARKLPPPPPLPPELMPKRRGAFDALLAPRDAPEAASTPPRLPGGPGGPGEPPTLPPAPSALPGADALPSTPVHTGADQGQLASLRLATDLSNCLMPLLTALNWRGDPRHVAESVPHFIDSLDITSFRNIMATLHFQSRPVPLSLSRIDPRLFPCLFLPPKGDALILLGQDGDRIVAFDGGQGGEVRIPRAKDKGLAYFFSRIEEDELAPAQAKVGWFKAVNERFRALFYQTLGITFVLNILALVTPLFVMAVYDKVVATGSLVTLAYFAVGVSIAIGCDLILRGIRTRILAFIGARLDNI